MVSWQEAMGGETGTGSGEDLKLGIQIAQTIHKTWFQHVHVVFIILLIFFIL